MYAKLICEVSVVCEVGWGMSMYVYRKASLYAKSMQSLYVCKVTKDRNR